MTLQSLKIIHLDSKPYMMIFLVSSFFPIVKQSCNTSGLCWEPRVLFIFLEDFLLAVMMSIRSFTRDYEFFMVGELNTEWELSHLRAILVENLFFRALEATCPVCNTLFQDLIRYNSLSFFPSNAGEEFPKLVFQGTVSQSFCLSCPIAALSGQPEPHEEVHRMLMFVRVCLMSP
jgi:hypothetical protein